MPLTRHRLNVILLTTILVSTMLGVRQVYSQAWPGPQQSPLGIGTLSSILDVSDLVSLPQITPLQSVNSALFVGHNTVNPAGYGVHLPQLPSTLDGSGSANRGRQSSIVVPSDGLPAIAYFDAVLGAVKFFKCGDPTCSRYNVIRTIDDQPTAVVGTNLSMALGSDGNPIIAYWDSTNNDLKFARCANADCSGSISVVTIDDPATESILRGSGVDIGFAPDGFPIMSYIETSPTPGVITAKCSNLSCAAPVYINTIQAGASLDTTIVSAIGKPLLIIISQDFSMRILECTNASANKCSSVSLRQSFSENQRDNIAAGFGSDGYPTIVFDNETADTINLYKCLDATCFYTLGPRQIANATDSEGLDITFSQDGNPIIAYHHGTSIANYELRVAACATPTCSQLVSTPVTVQSGGAGIDASIAMGKDNLPVIAHGFIRGVSTADLAFVHCGTAVCDSGATRYGAFGAALSAASPYFVPPSFLNGNTSVGVYGYANSGAANEVGIYGKTTSATGSAIYGSAAASNGYGGIFYGPVSIIDNATSGAQGNLTVTNTLTAGASMNIIGTNTTTVNFTVNFSLTDPVVTPLWGTTSGGVSSDPMNIGIYGASTAAGTARSGISATTTNFAIGLNAISVSGIAVYGYSPGTFANGMPGAGIVAEAANEIAATNALGIEASSPLKGVVGESSHPLVGNVFLTTGGAATPSATTTTSGVGILACGTAYAAKFNGDLWISNSLHVATSSVLYVKNAGGAVIGKVIEPQITIKEQDLINITNCLNHINCP